MVEHTGTHVDAFFHMTPDGLSIDQMPLDLFFGKAVCLDMRHIPARGSITIQDLEQAEQEAGVTAETATLCCWPPVCMINTFLPKISFS